MLNTALPEPERALYLTVERLAFGAALLAAHPHLRLAVLYYGSELDPYAERHLVAHDGSFAYDAAGARPLHAELLSADSFALGLGLQHAVELLELPFEVAAVDAARAALRTVS